MNFIEEYYPNYSGSDLVLEADILQRFLDNEEVFQDDYNNLIRHYLDEEGGVETALKNINNQLLEGALKAFFESDDCHFSDETTDDKYPKTLLIHNTVGGMVWKVYHVKNRNEARFLSLNAKRNGFFWRRLVELEDEQETFSDWRENSDFWLKIAKL